MSEKTRFHQARLVFDKKRMKLMMLALLGFFLGTVFVDHALARGSATVSWTAPIANEDASTPVDLAGYSIFYSTSVLGCTNWDATINQADRQSAALFSVAHVDVAEAETLKSSTDATKRGYTFSTSNLLTPGLTYNFTVVAFDSSGNYSKCVNDAGSNKTRSKFIYHTGNLKNSGKVGLSDLSILAGDFGKTAWCRIANHSSDINGDCAVNLSDLSIFAGEWGL